jgi:hypothetical protein
MPNVSFDNVCRRYFFVSDTIRLLFFSFAKTRTFRKLLNMLNDCYINRLGFDLLNLDKILKARSGKKEGGILVPHISTVYQLSFFILSEARLSMGATEGRRPGVATWVQSARVLGRQKGRKNFQHDDGQTKITQSHMGTAQIFVFKILSIFLHTHSECFPKLFQFLH